MTRTLFGDIAPERPQVNVKLFDFSARLLHETREAFLVFDGSKKVWLPKQFTENNGDGTFTIPEWLAVEKELA